MLKSVSLLIALALILISLPAVNSHASPGLLVDTSTHFIQVPASVGAPANDKISLAATLYQPRFFPSAPAVIYIHGWGGHRLMGEDNLAYYIANAGYTVLSYTARGFGSGESGGRVTLAGPNELNDLKRVIDWLLNDPDSVIGPRVTKIGVIGGSYGGSHSLQIASDPRVSAVIPLVGWTNLEEALFPNGAINYKLGLGEFYGGLETTVGSAPFFNYDRIEFEMFDASAEGRAPTGSVKQELRDRSIAERDANGREVLIRGREPRAPIFIVQSWDDYLFPSTQVLDVYSQITAPKQIYFGRRGHPPGGNESDPEEVYIAAAVLRWFNHYLLGIGGTDSKKVATAAEPSIFLPVSYSQFPPSDSTTLPLYLRAGGLIAKKKKKENLEERAGGIFRPRLIRSSRLGAEIPPKSDMFSATVEQTGSLPRSLVYTSGQFDSDTEMMGPAEFTLYVGSATSESVDVITRIFDVGPDGVETEVTVGVARVSGLVAGEAKRVDFRDFGDNWIFRKNHALRVKVTNIDFPDFRPPGENDDLPSEFTLRTGKKFPSSLKLAVRKR
ncbi:MAG: CocE/NonD family hydrolase [Blastocatellia bacterium]